MRIHADPDTDPEPKPWPVGYGTVPYLSIELLHVPQGSLCSDSHPLYAIPITAFLMNANPGLTIEIMGEKKVFQKYTPKNEWQRVYLLSLDSACKLLNLLQLLGSLQHVCHMLRSLTQINCRSNSLSFNFSNKVADPDPHYFGSRIRIHIRVKIWIRIRI